jgi:outer membrane receptor protein involved in Fe transport
MNMHSSHSHLAALIASVIAAAGAIQHSAPAIAQEDSENILEEVTVTASRREESLQDVAMAVSVVDIDALADAGLTGLTDVLTFVPGVSVTNSGGSFNNIVYIRGINAALAAGVVSYVDDIPFGSSTVYANPTPLDGTLLDLASLDVLRGPQGTLYGASALGGLMKFVTREPSLEEWTGNVSADLSTTEGGGLNQMYRVSANGPIAADALGLSFTAFWKEKEGYVDNVTIPLDGWDDYEYYGGSGSLRWAATDRLELKLQGLFQNSQQDGFATIQTNHADDVLLPGVGQGEPWYGDYATGAAQVNPSEYDTSVLGLTIDYRFDFATLTSVTSTQDMSFGQNLDVTIPFASFADLFFPQNAPHSSALLVAEQGFDKFTQEFRLTSPSNEQFEWILGAYYAEEEGFNIQQLVTEPAEPEFYFANFPSNYEEYSLFATGTWYFTPDLDASFGIRYADYSNDVVLNTVGPLVAPLPLSEIEDDVTNYLLNLRYRAGDNMSFYSRIASGYRPGGANFLILDPMGNPLSEPFYEPDSLWSYEVGVKGSTADGRFGYDVAAFYIDWEDYIISLSRGGVTVSANAESAASRGVEASLSFAATDALVFTGTLTYIDAEISEDTPDLGAADGDQLPNTPEWQFALDAEYRFSLGSLPSYVGGSVRYKGDMPVGFPGYTDSDGAFHPSSAPRLTIDSYTLVDLRAGLALGQIDLAFYITNAFDEYGYTHYGPSSVSPSLATPTRPRTYGVVARWNFF